MVNDIIANINKSNQTVEKQQYTSESNYKPPKRQSKKSRVKNCSQVGEFEQIPDSTFRRRRNLSEPHKISDKPVAPTKVKSASWKRSEKSTAQFNNLTNKKHKKSPNWLRFSYSKTKKLDADQPCNGNESLSACRPGTTYSDVLFGAGCSNLVKIKNCIPPRFYSNQSSNAAQRKLTKSLFKFNSKSENKTLAESEAEEKKTLFPALQTIKNKLFPVSLKIGANSSNAEKTQVSENKPLCTFPTSSPNKNDGTEILVFADLEDLSLNENKTSNDNGLEQHLRVNNDLENTAANSVNGNKYLVNSITKIPKWNFMCVETGVSDGFPKFLCQFEDENYLKSEKMALLGLKLALGNFVANNK